MDNKINLSQLSDLFAQAGGMSKNASDRFVRTFFDTIADRVISDGIVKVKGFGTFKLTSVDNRESINVNTGERFIIEGYKKISFTPDPELKEAVNSPFAAFETVMLTSEQADVLDEMEKPAQPPIRPVTEPIYQAGKPLHTVKTVQNNVKPEVKEITQKRHTVIILRVLAVILSVVLILGLLSYLFWPSLATNLMERMCKGYDTLEQEVVVETNATSSAVSTALQSEETLEPAAEASKPAAEASNPVAEASNPVAEASKPAAEASNPVAEASNTVAEVLKPAAETSTFVADSNHGAVNLKVMDEDLKRDLSEFTAADTLNYRISGLLAEHTVAQDETLTRIALKYYGTKKLWPYIAQYNKELNMNKIHPGVRIKIPRLENK